MGVEQLGQLGEVGERAGEPVDLVDDHDVDKPVAHIVEQPVQSGPLHRPAGQAAIVIGRRHEDPALSFWLLTKASQASR